MPASRNGLAPVRAVVQAAAVAYSKRSRTHKAKRFCRTIRDNNVHSVLLVGAESAAFSWSNIVERAVIASGAWVVVSGLGPDLDFPATAVLCDGLRLPFADKSFDLVLSNAVIEHVGDAVDQAAFIAEHGRVGRSFIVTTPNRWFPIESHTRIIGRHWSPRWRASRAEFTRLLSRAELRALLPPGARITGHQWSPTFTAEGYEAR